jgi:hypothetical protein
VRWLIALAAVVMVSLTYGENLYAHVPTRKLAHYVADGMHIAWLYLLGGAIAALCMRKCRERLAIIGICAAGGAEGAMTAIAGLIGDPRVIPSQWGGMLGEMIRLPLAAIGLCVVCVWVCWLWDARDE